MSTAALGFTVTGEFLTEHFRQRVLEGAWRNAFNDLPDCLEGCDTEITLQVLKGEKKFVGRSGMSGTGISLADETDAADYLEQLDWHFGHLVKIDKVWMEPYAVVTNYGPEDYFATERYLDPNDATGAERVFRSAGYLSEDCHLVEELRPRAERALFYADDQRRDKSLTLIVRSEALGCPCPMNVLFREITDPPVWISGAATPQAAVDKAESESGRSLDRRGCMETFGTTDIPLEKDPGRIRVAALAANDARNRRYRRELSDEDVETISRYHRSRANPDASEAVIESLRLAILKQNEELCQGRTVAYDFGGPIGPVEIPEGPLLCWALKRTAARDQAPAWQVVSPANMKMFNDDRFHSDWMIGAGIDLAAYSDVTFREAQSELMSRLQEEILEFDVTVLVKGRGHAVGTIVHPKPGDIVSSEEIAVIPNAGADYYEIAKTAGAVICTRGGRMSHLAVVGLEENFLIVMDPGAFNAYPAGSLVAIDADKGEIEIMAAPSTSS